MTEREKIIEIIAPFVSAYGEDEAIANALIEASIVDVTEYKHRAEVAEEALWLACVNLVKEEKDNFDVELLARVVYTKFLRKAEKKLTEEKGE